MSKPTFSQIKQALYIKLGEGGKWERTCFADGTIRAGYYEVPPEFSLARDHDGIRQVYLRLGKDEGTATRYAGELLKFYEAGSETLWITFSGGSLHWAVAEGPAEYLGSDSALYPAGSTLRQTASGWQKTSLSGKSLPISELSGRLTKVAGYRGTICAIKDWEFNYLLRRLQDQEIEEVQKAKAVRIELLKACETLITFLPWPDFELLVDLVFTNSGWRRMGSLGGDQKTSDLELIQPMTGERAVVQVKSATTQQELVAYEDGFSQMNANRYFYVWHTCKGKLSSIMPDLTIMGPDVLAEHVLNAGLYDWLIRKAG